MACWPFRIQWILVIETCISGKKRKIQNIKDETLGIAPISKLRVTFIEVSKFRGAENLQGWLVTLRCSPSLSHTGSLESAGGGQAVLAGGS